MKKSHRENLRARTDCWKQRAREQERVAKEKIEELERTVRSTLQTRGVTSEDRLLQGLDPGPRSLIRGLLDGPSVGHKLVSPVTRGALCLLGKVTPVRPLGEWSPRGKGRDSVFRSLCEHLVAKYPTPPFLWSVFDDAVNAEVLVPLVVHVAGGGSLFQHCKDGGLPFTLTRAQCAEFMGTDKALGVLAALRRVQVKAEGGDRRLFEVWWDRQQNKALGTTLLEAFGLTVLRFFARNPLLSREQIGPVCDYVYHRYRRDPGFSMQGRTVNALLRDMNEWHRELNESKDLAKRQPVIFDKSGFKGYKVERTDTHGPVGKNGYAVEPQVWTITEILSSEDLRAEGRALHHCVYSYSSYVEDRKTSIWSLALTDVMCPTEKLVTLEVSNVGKTVVQARGKYNRLTTAQEDKVVMAWAVKNGLTIQYGKRW